MKARHERGNAVLDYGIGILSIAILMLATFLMPQLYSAFLDNKNLNQSHLVERETFKFKNPVSMTVKERVERMMEASGKKEGAKRTLYLTGADVKDTELIEGIREALSIAASYQLLPDLSAYEMEKHIIYAEYYNLSENTENSTEVAFWTVRFSDYQNFDFLLRVDAADYIIYQAEIYCPEAFDMEQQLTSLDMEVVSYQNNLFADGCADYFEAEGYDMLTRSENPDLILQMGYERGEYTIYRATCSSGYFESEGIRWGFVPMTIALERGSGLQDWGYGGIEAYYAFLYGIDIYEEEQETSLLSE